MDVEAESEYNVIDIEDVDCEPEYIVQDIKDELEPNVN